MYYLYIYIHENEADGNLSEGFPPIQLLIRIAEKFDLQHLNFHSYQLLTIPMKLSISFQISPPYLTLAKLLLDWSCCRVRHQLIACPNERKASEFMTIDEPQPTKDSGGFGCISDVILRELFGNSYKQTNHFNSNARLWPQVGCGQRHVATKAWRL